MREVVPGVHLIEGLRAANAYLLADEAGLTLVDCGIGGDADRIAAQV